MDQRQVRRGADSLQRGMDRKAVAQLRYKREYMRRWRSDPRNFERELHTRLRAQLARRVRPMYGERRLYLNRRGRPVCGFCWHRPPIKLQERLRISEDARSEFVKVLIPCCGEC